MNEYNKFSFNLCLFSHHDCNEGNGFIGSILYVFFLNIIYGLHAVNKCHEMIAIWIIN